MCSTCAATMCFTCGRNTLHLQPWDGTYLRGQVVDRAGFGAFPLVWENELAEAGIQWVSFLSLAERLEGRMTCRCTTTW